MIGYVVVWALAGIAIGALVHAAQLGFRARAPRLPRPGLLTLGVGLVAALLGGLLGWWLFGRFFSTPMALWVGVVGATVTPWAAGRATPPTA